MFIPKLSARVARNFNEDKLAFLGLIRLDKVDFESPEINLADGMKILRSDKLTDWANELKGEECWSDERIREYRVNNPDGRYETVSAYAGCPENSIYAIDYGCSWTDSKFYLVQETPKDTPSEEAQATFEHQRSTALSALSLASGARVTCAPAVSFVKMYGSSDFGAFMSREGRLLPFVGNDKIYHFGMKEESVLKNLVDHIILQNHPEAYLATLRFIRSIKRRDADDALVDLMIALEALLNDTGQIGIAFRISQRLSHLLSQDKECRRTVQDAIKRAYRYRSELVHGSKRETQILENRIFKSRKGKIIDEELWAIVNELKIFVCDALLVRYLNYGDRDQKWLFSHLDDLAI